MPLGWLRPSLSAGRPWLLLLLVGRRLCGLPPPGSTWGCTHRWTSLRVQWRGWLSWSASSQSKARRDASGRWRVQRRTACPGTPARSTDSAAQSYMYIISLKVPAFGWFWAPCAFLPAALSQLGCLSGAVARSCCPPLAACRPAGSLAVQRPAGCTARRAGGAAAATPAPPAAGAHPILPVLHLFHGGETCTGGPA